MSVFCDIFALKLLYQIMDEKPELAKGAAKALHDFYEVVTHGLLSSDLRYALFNIPISLV